MRRRSRDIQIFNLSMMDVITGAMGAFLIVMVVLARYYESDPGNRQKVDALKAELAEARDRLRDIDLAFQRTGQTSGDVTQALNRARRNLNAAERDLEKLREQLDQAKQELERKDKTIRELDDRRAFVVFSGWPCKNVDVDIYVWDSQRAEKDKSPTPPFDPTKKQGSRWPDDFHVDWETTGADSWIVSSAVDGAEFKIYLRLVNPAAVTRPCQVNSKIIHASGASSFVTTLSKSDPWALIGRVRQDSSKKFSYFKVERITPAEQEAEKRAISRRGVGG
jgi:hypothetical protein